MLEKIYELLGHKDIFSIKSEGVREFAVGKAHNHLMRILLRCKELGIISEINEDLLDKIESENC